jgi:MinD-like ATPase involved in chromosome partitioning or flagellar assembly
VLDFKTAKSPGVLEMNKDRGAKSIAVWGSAGSGKTMLAINLAFELTRLNQKVLLVDLDLRRPSVTSWLGLVDAGPGITAAMRLARANRLEMEEVMRLCAELRFGSSKVDILTGLSSPVRWPEVRIEDLATLLSAVAPHFDLIVFDLNDDLSDKTLVESEVGSRERVTRWIVESVDLLLATFIADPVGINRFLFDLSSTDRDLWPVANRLSARGVGKSAAKQLRELLSTFTSSPIRAELPSDTASCDATISNARPLLLESPNSKLTLAIRALAADILDESTSRLNSEGGKN